MEQLLIEHWGQPGDTTITVNELNESTDNLKPGLYIEGIFLQADVVNRNKRLYPKAVMEKAVTQYIKEQVRSKQALGELNHPPRAMVDPMQAAIIIEDMWWEGSNVKGRARIIEGDNGPGDKVAALIRAGWIPGVSSRGLGSVAETGKGYSVVKEGYRLTVGVDVVWGPSAPDAWVQPRLVESQDPTVETQVKTKAQDAAFLKLAENLEHK